MNDYTHDDFIKDLSDPEIPHVKNRVRFKNFYDQLGTGHEQRVQGCVMERLNFIEPVGDILELGCHNGFNCVYYAKKGFNCVGVDVSTTLIERGKQIIKEEGLEKKVQFINSFIEDYIPDKKHETVLVTETLEHVIDPIPILKKAKECIKENGKLYISVPSYRWGNNSHLRGIDINQLSSMLEGVGFCIEKIYIENDTTFCIAKL